MMTDIEWDDDTNTLKGTIGDDLAGGVSVAIIATKTVLQRELGSKEAARITPAILDMCEEMALALWNGNEFVFDNRKDA